MFPFLVALLALIPAPRLARAATNVVEKSTSQKPQSDPRVAPVWQEYMLKQVAEKKHKGDSAWGLFSEGGWADAGQVIIYADSDWRRARVELAEPGAKDVGHSRALTPREITALRRVTEKSALLKDVDAVAFDALTFEFVHMKRQQNGTVTVVKRLLVRNPGTLTIPQHDELINAYQSLRSTLKKK